MAEEGQSVAHRGMVPSGRSSSSGVIPKVISSVHTLLANRSWAEITVLDICNEAEISVSSLYARFSVGILGLVVGGVSTASSAIGCI